MVRNGPRLGDARRCEDPNVTLFQSWRIVEASSADLELDLDCEEPAHLTLDAAGKGSMVFDLLGATVDARLVDDHLECTWEGAWELDDMCGRGRADLAADGDLRIHLWIHRGDEIDLRATPS